MALYNRNNATASITGLFSSLPGVGVESGMAAAAADAKPRAKGELERHAPTSAAALAATTPLKLAARDVWAQQDLGIFAGGYTAQAIPPHSTVVIKLTKP